MRFHYNKTILSLALSFFFLQGCAKNDQFLPLKDGEMLHFTATIPDELEALPLYAMYRSEICRKNSRTANMKSYTVPGYHSEKYPLIVLTSNQVIGEIPREGEGSCDWKLSNIIFEVKLKDPAKIDPLISTNFGFETTFVIDNNAPQTFDGGYLKKSGNMEETLVLFPLISEHFIDGNIKQFRLMGKDRVLTYKLSNANNINIIVDYKSEMKTYWFGVKKKEAGNMATIIYPNGEKEKTREIYPDYEKLINISESMHHK
ncbi:hypothetical protein [Providencia manganoxydans]|uniref:hypothetical protein n=1 Tax=Providencia manganoxydans TaxID=2923283 RepID=UPI0032DA3E29